MVLDGYIRSVLVFKTQLSIDKLRTGFAASDSDSIFRRTLLGYYAEGSCNFPPTLPKLQPPPIPTQAVDGNSFSINHAMQGYDLKLNRNWQNTENLIIKAIKSSRAVEIV